MDLDVTCILLKFWLLFQSCSLLCACTHTYTSAHFTPKQRGRHSYNFLINLFFPVLENRTFESKLGRCISFFHWFYIETREKFLKVFEWLWFCLFVVHIRTLPTITWLFLLLQIFRFLLSENVFFLVLIPIHQRKICLSHYFLLSILDKFFCRINSVAYSCQWRFQFHHRVFNSLQIFSHYFSHCIPFLSVLLPLHLILWIFKKIPPILSQ